jgi:hypothetical protein
MPAYGSRQVHPPIMHEPRIQPPLPPPVAGPPKLIPPTQAGGTHPPLPVWSIAQPESPPQKERDVKFIDEVCIQHFGETLGRPLLDDCDMAHQGFQRLMFI